MWLDMEERDEAAMDTDIDSADAYVKRWFILKQQALSVITPPKSDASNSLTRGTVKGINEESPSIAESKQSVSRNFLKLPSFELPSFDGQVKNWIGFWAQFRKIHEEALELSDDDKMHFLLQAMEKGSPARELIESFPPCGENYNKAISQLRQRFARDDLIIDYYVRELLQLVISKGVSKLSMRSLYDKLMTQILALESLGLTENRYAALLYPLVESALPDETLRAWNRSNFHTEKKENPLSQLLEFLKFEVESEERIRVARFDANYLNTQNTPTASCLATSVKNDHKSKEAKEVIQTCIWCEKSYHTSSECTTAMKMSLEERRQFLIKNRACCICLRKGHIAKTCRKYPKCVLCGKRHYTLMCSDIASIKCDNTLSTNDSTPSTSKGVMLCQTFENKTVLLQTLKVYVSNGERILPVRVLLDTGAQRTYVKTDIIKKLDLLSIGEQSLTQNLFGGATTKRRTYRIYNLKISSMDKRFNCSINALEQPVLCGYLPKLREGSIIHTLRSKGIILTDSFDDDTEIGILIGSDVLGTLLTGRMEHVNESLVAMETKLGWTIQGPAVGAYCSGDVSNTLHASTSFGNVEEFWRLETLGINDDAVSKTQKSVVAEVESFFKNTICINDEGRYEVRLPWKSKDLQPNYDLALARLKSTTSRLKHLGIIDNYDAVFREWLELGIIEKVEVDDTQTGHYMPHHAVVRESSATTRIRPVFDASAKDKNGLSLNSCLQKGINLIELIPKLLIQFRKHNIGIIADIKKAFLQISLHSDDRHYLKFLWWSDVHDPQPVIATFWHKRVVFGVTTSPYLLAATILHHLQKYDGEIASLLRSSFYVDNLVVSVKSENEMRAFVSEANKIMLDGKFELRCWVTGPCLVDEDVISTSVLGILWDPRCDTLKCKIPLPELKKITKRFILSVAQSTFDPLGFLSPATLIPKLIIQKCWLSNLDWDQPLPVELEKKFVDWYREIDNLNSCSIPRRVSPLDLDKCDISLHIFCDGSQAAYACCIFLRTEFQREVSVRLLIAKSRVAPTKRVTIPRIELLSALIASRLASEAKKSLGILCKEYYWSDSEIVLSWIKKQSGLEVFVQNRVSEIISKTNVDDWYHVPGNFNPADLPSRGCNPKELVDSQWWNGPSWLYGWDWLESVRRSPTFEKEVTCCLSVPLQTEKFTSRFEYFGNYNKIVRVMGWCLRFLRKCRKSSELRIVSRDLSSQEYEAAERQLFKNLQIDYFSKDEAWRSMKLDLIKSKDELLLVRTRLTFSGDTESFITPILLPGASEIVERLVFLKHKDYLHAGSQTLLAKLRDNFWIVGGRKLTRRTVRKCVICRRFNAKSCVGPVPPLPENRLRCTKPFQVTGVDFAGPLVLRSGEKCWIALFTCAVYRAVHLELCMSLSTEEFVLALRRFLARRGQVDVVYSDNGTNFHGAYNVLKDIDWDEVDRKTNKITWRFIPPAAPWWGGFWERMVRTVKGILRRVLGRAALVFQEMVTILCEVESIVNSRPLTYIADSSENLVPLTPSNFLQFSSNISSNNNIDIEMIDGRILSSRWRYITGLCADLKRRFRSEYLGLLTHKRGTGRTSSVKPGDIVIIETEKKRVEWPLGLVLETIPGSDGFSRVVRVKTATGIKIRSFQSIYPLELSSQTIVEKPEAYVTRSGRHVRVPDRLEV